jgi:hypothetical protein
MTKVRVKREALLSFAVATLCVAACLAWLELGIRRDSRDDERRTPHPKLFQESSSCPTSSDHVVLAARLEERARLRADRYAYDPRDGILSVERYREAEACYRAAGDHDGASRTSEMVATMSARIDADYATARLNLINALTRERWHEALSIVRRLLLLTDHLGRNEYVEWLHQIEGRVSARAATAS